MITNDNQSSTSTNTVADNYREKMSLKISEFIASSRHEQPTTATVTAIALSYSEDRINNNCAVSSQSHAGLDIMSNRNFTILSFDQHQSSSSTQLLMDGSETLLSPAEVPFGRRYAEISQFKNHPNVEW